jgi:hypothetical protein
MKIPRKIPRKISMIIFAQNGMLKLMNYRKYGEMILRKKWFKPVIL